MLLHGYTLNSFQVLCIPAIQPYVNKYVASTSSPPKTAESCPKQDVMQEAKASDADTNNKLQPIKILSHLERVDLQMRGRTFSVDSVLDDQVSPSVPSPDHLNHFTERTDSKPNITEQQTPSAKRSTSCSRDKENVSCFCSV